MGKKKGQGRRRHGEWKFQEDFKAVLALPERLAQYLRLLLHLDVAMWTFCLDKLRQGASVAYREYSLSKGPGKGVRRFAAPCDELKSVQKSILERFLHSIPVHFARHGNQRGCSILSNARHHAGFAKAVFEIDIVNAFPSVYRSRMRTNLHGRFVWALKMFQGIVFSEEDVKQMVEALVDLVCLHDRLPQGPPTSPRLFDLVCMSLDSDVYGFLEMNATHFQGYRYTAYADNLTISSDGDMPQEIRDGLLEIIRKNGFFPHAREDKTKYYSKATGELPVITGIVIPREGDHLTMAPTKVNQIRARLYHALQQPAWNDEMRGQVAGTLGFVRQVYPDKLPSKLRKEVPAVEARLKAMTPVGASSIEPTTALKAATPAEGTASKRRPARRKAKSPKKPRDEGLIVTEAVPSRVEAPTGDSDAAAE